MDPCFRVTPTTNLSSLRGETTFAPETLPALQFWQVADIFVLVAGAGEEQDALGGL